MPEVSKSTPAWEQSTPPDESDYPLWLKASHGVDLAREKLRYESATAIALQEAKSTGLWTEFQAQRRDLADVYLQETHFQ